MSKSDYKYGKGISYDTKCFLHSYEGYKTKTKSRFHYITKDFKDFDVLSEEKKNQLKLEAESLKDKLYIENDKFCPMCYKVMEKLNNDVTLENKYTIEEAIALLIETVDPSLKLLKISRKYNTNLEIETISTKILGFYDLRLIDFEREYARKFKKSNSSILMKKLEANNS